MSKLSRIVGVVSVLLVGTVLALYGYIQSTHFRSSIGETLTSVLGESVELGKDIEVLGVYPNISISLPNAKLRGSDKLADLRRARVQNLQLSISPDVLFSSGAKGEVRISADNLTIITESVQSSIATEPPAPERRASDAPTQSVAELAASIRQRLTDLDVELRIAELDYYARDEKAGNRVYRLADIAISHAQHESIDARANLLEGEGIRQQVTLNIQSSSTAVESVDNIKGTINLTAAREQIVEHQLHGQWALEKNDLILDTIEYESADVLLRGDMAIGFGEHEISVESALELRKLNIHSSDSDDESSVQDSPQERMFSYELFNLDIPKNLFADVSLYLGAVRLNNMPVLNGQLQFNLSDGILDVSSEDLSLLGGKADLTVQVDNTLAQLIGFDLKLEADDIELERIRSSGDNDTILNRGKADAIIALRGSGPSAGHIVATLDGYVITTVKAAQVKQKYSTLIDVGVVSWAVDKLSLLSKDDDARKRSANLSDPLTIDCASLRLYINDGRVEVSNGAIVELRDNVLFGSGYVDLKSETMGFAFRTKNRNLFDWSAISIAKYAEVGGSLSAPSITLNASELAKQGILSASSVAWGPLPSLVYSLAESGVKNMQSTQCTPDIN